MSKFLPIGERLREEREKLELNQGDFACLGGCTRKTQYNYEVGERAPDAVYLAAIAAAGADVQYILTGIHSINMPSTPYPSLQSETYIAAQDKAGYTVTLRPDQAALLDNIEHCAKEDQEAIKRMAFLAASADKNETQSRTKDKAVNGD